MGLIHLDDPDYIEKLATVVRAAWIAWASMQPNVKPSWLVPYEKLSEADKEADRQIGKYVATYVLSEYFDVGQGEDDQS